MNRISFEDLALPVFVDERYHGDRHCEDLAMLRKVLRSIHEHPRYTAYTKCNAWLVCTNFTSRPLFVGATQSNRFGELYPVGYRHCTSKQDREQPCCQLGSILQAMEERISDSLMETVEPDQWCDHEDADDEDHFQYNCYFHGWSDDDLGNDDYEELTNDQFDKAFIQLTEIFYLNGRSTDNMEDEHHD